jgi:hypothetical protein
MANGDKGTALSVMIGGEAGYGMKTSGETLARSFSRGGNNLCQIIALNEGPLVSQLSERHIRQLTERFI